MVAGAGSQGDKHPSISSEVNPNQSSGLSDAQITTGFTLLAITTFATSIAMQTSQAIQPNFMRDVIGMDGAQNGYLIAIRELPGFLLIFVAALLLRLGLARAAAFSLVVMGVGYSLMSLTDSFGQLILPTLIASVGFHSWLQLQPALGLSIAPRGNEGSVLGRLYSIGSLGSFLALFAVLLVLLGVEHFRGDLRDFQEPYLRWLFVGVGVSAVVGAFAVARFPVSASDLAAARVAPKVVWRQEYRLYYALSFLDGSRQQIYFAFAPFVLVEEFNVNARSITILLIVSAVINWRTGSFVGRMVDVHGEKNVLTVAYVLHFIVFLGFAFSSSVWMLYVFYLGYLWLFLFYVGTTTYLRKIAHREDIPASLAMGVSLAHLTAVIVPIIGAALWSRLGYQFPFLFGTVFCLASLYLTQKIDIEKQRISGHS
ncbi:MAG: MFS transporter [Thermomicrobiales bacterium]